MLDVARPAAKPRACRLCLPGRQNSNGDVGALRNGVGASARRGGRHCASTPFLSLDVRVSGGVFRRGRRRPPQRRLRRRAWQSTVGHVAGGRARAHVLSSLRRVQTPISGPAEPVPDVRRTRADADETRRTHRSRAAFRLRDRPWCRTAEANVAQPYRCRDDYRLRQPAGDIPHPSKRSIPRLHLHGRPTDEPHRVPVRDRRSAGARNRPRRRRSSDAALTSHLSDARVSRGARRRQAGDTGAPRQDRPADSRHDRAQRSAPRRPRWLGCPVRSRVERNRRPCPLPHRQERYACPRGQTYRTVSSAPGALDTQDLESTGGRPARCSVDVSTPAARLSRRRKHDQSPLVDFGHSARCTSSRPTRCSV